MEVRSLHLPLQETSARILQDYRLLKKSWRLMIVHIFDIWSNICRCYKNTTVIFRKITIYFSQYLILTTSLLQLNKQLSSKQVITSNISLNLVIK